MARRVLGGLLFACCFVTGCTMSDERFVAKMRHRPAPDFELKSLDGATVKLSDFKGKPVVLAFFAFG